MNILSGEGHKVETAWTFLWHSHSYIYNGLIGMEYVIKLFTDSFCFAISF